MKRFIPFVLGAAMVSPMLAGCDKKIAEDKTVEQKANGDVKSSDTTVKQQPDGTMVKEKTEKVDTNNNAK